MDQHLQIMRRNQEIIHSQQDEPLQEFPDIPVFPPVPDPYASLTPAELATFGVCPSYALAGSNNDNDDDDSSSTDDYSSKLEEEEMNLPTGFKEELLIR